MTKLASDWRGGVREPHRLITGAKDGPAGGVGAQEGGRDQRCSDPVAVTSTPAGSPTAGQRLRPVCTGPALGSMAP